jgi:hypothetical protein
MRKYLLFMTTLLVVVMVIVANFGVASEATARGEVLDQSQEGVNYGFWFEDDVIRWQEFMPTLDNLTAIEIYVQKDGSPGNIIAEIRTVDGRVLASESIEESAVSQSGWLRVDLSSRTRITPGTKYRIYVYANQDSPSPDNRYFWRGSTESVYDSNCKNDVIDSWPTYDYAFKTYGKSGWQGAYSVLFEDQSDLDLMRQYRDEFLIKRESGRLFTRLLYESSEEALEVLLNNPRLISKARRLIEANRDAVAEVVDGNRGVIYNTDEITSFLDAYARKSPASLKLLTTTVKKEMLEKQEQGEPFLGFELH